MLDLLDDALYSDDLLRRDGARHQLAEVADPKAISALIGLLDAPHKTTRRRAAAILGEVRPERVVPPLVAALGDEAVALRTRVAAARLLTVFSPDGVPALAAGLRHPEARLRKACATPAAGAEALVAALADPDPEVADEAAAALAEAELPVPQGFFSPHRSPGVLRLRALTDGSAPALVEAARAGDPAALDHLSDIETLRALLHSPHRAAAAHALGRLHQADAAWAHDPDPRVRAAAARALDLAALVEDPDPTVAWFARRRRAGAFGVEPARLAPHARLQAPSAQPPYGIQADDLIEEIERAPAALALCQPRFDINLGVAVRSAEAAGLREVFLVGRAGLFRSPARGTDRVIPVHPVADAAALVRRAREGGYQLVVVQQTPASVPYHTADYPPRPLFVMGAEDRGVPALLREVADLLVEIPLFGAIDSLNVAAAATTVMFHWRCTTTAAHRGR
jgi:23S rRNA (guanosine2251-2'-O)-methyltransferase